MTTPNVPLAALLLLLASCASTPAPPMDAKKSPPPWISFACSDGQMVQASYPDTDTALIRIRSRTFALHIAISGSGARYTGDGWQWWTKGMHDGMLAPLAAGESIASAPGVTCHAG
jgi:membrane-bound inhibitor of C-type lysozyme